MRIHCLQHVPFEGPGAISDWAADRGAELAATALFAGEPLPDIEDFDWLVVLGGPMSVNDTGRYPFLGLEMALIQTAADAGRGVLGLCLGGQLIARALGGTVTRAPEREIGWWPVRMSDAMGQWSLPNAFDAFHWHGETFAPPAGARHIAASDGCPNQGFAIGERVVGLQFHLETTPAAARALIHHCPEDLAPGRWVQGAADMIDAPERFARANGLMGALLDRLTGVAVPS